MDKNEKLALARKKVRNCNDKLLKSCLNVLLLSFAVEEISGQNLAPSPTGEEGRGRRAQFTATTLKEWK